MSFITASGLYGAITSTNTATTTLSGMGYSGTTWIQQTLPEYYTSDPLKQAIYEVLRAENPYNTGIYSTVQRIYRRITEKLLMEMWDVEGMIPAESAEERAAKAQNQTNFQQAMNQQMQAQLYANATQAAQSYAGLQNNYNGTLTSTY